MNEAQLTEQLRALRQPAPDGGFEARLQQALWREAQAMRADRVPARRASARRLLRWGGRMSVGVAVALGATAAAAAAGGVWAFVVQSAPAPVAEEATPSREVPPPAPTPAVAAPRGMPPTPAQALDVPAADPTGAVAPVELASPEAPSHERPLPTAPEHRAAKNTVAPRPEAKPAVRVSTGSAAVRSSDANSASRQAPAVSQVAPGAALLPFDLPERGKTAPPPSRASTADPGAGREHARVERAQHPLPDVAARGQARRARPEHLERGEGRRAPPDRSERGMWPPGREIAKERSGRDNAERGLERAREARERKK